MLADALKEEICYSPFVHIDDTRVQVLKEKGRAPQTKSFMWVMRGYSNRQREGPLIYFDYSTSRGSKVIENLLEDYNGVMISDGLAANVLAADNLGIDHAICNSHCRRRFHQSWKLEKSKTAKWFIDKYGELYHLESIMRKMKVSEDTVLPVRQKHSTKIMQEMMDKCREIQPHISKSTKLADGVSYMLKFQKGLQMFLENPIIPPDNNRVENDIRPFVIGRKNWLFFDTADGAWASTVLYSLIESAKANGLNPEKYLLWLFNHYDEKTSPEEIRAMLPNCVSPEQVG